MLHHEARVGDIVKRSDVPDAPEMRVWAYDGGGNLHCEWKGENGREEATFCPSLLVMVSKRSVSAVTIVKYFDADGDAQTVAEKLADA